MTRRNEVGYSNPYFTAPSAQKTSEGKMTIIQMWELGKILTEAQNLGAPSAIDLPLKYSCDRRTKRIDNHYLRFDPDGYKLAVKYDIESPQPSSEILPLSWVDLPPTLAHYGQLNKPEEVRIRDMRHLVLSEALQAVGEIPTRHLQARIEWLIKQPAPNSQEVVAKLQELRQQQYVNRIMDQLKLFLRPKNHEYSREDIFAEIERLIDEGRKFTSALGLSVTRVMAPREPISNILHFVPL